MADAQPGSAFYERSWFKGTAAVVALAVSLAALVGPPRLWDVIADIVSPELPGSNTEIVIDASAAMGEEFPPSGSKLQAQAGAVKRYAANLSNEGLALRTFGGECDEGGDLVVDLGEEHGDDVGRAAADQQPQGKANLVSALARAIDDFTADDIPDDSKNRVVVFTGTGTDECYGTNAPAEINREIERTGIDAEFRLVGLHVEKADQQQLQSISDALGKNAEVLFAPTKAELDAAVDELPDGGDGGTTTTTGTSDGASDESQVLPAD